MIRDVSELLDQYRGWLRQKTTVRETGEWVEITTPFLDRHNDCVQIFARRENESWILSDDGYTLGDLLASGLDVDSSEKRRELLRATLNGFGVRRGEGGDLLVTATDAEFAHKKHNLIQAVLGVGDLFFTSRTNVRSLFFEEVRDWFFENEIRAAANVHLVGKSGYDHRIDFIIPPSPRQPERLVRLINNPTKERVESVSFSWIDIKEEREPGTRAYAVINDTARHVSEAVAEALNAYEIKPIIWSRRADATAELAA